LYAEEDAITLLTEVDGVFYVKNDEKIKHKPYRRV
jgi:hypothetical protein